MRKVATISIWICYSSKRVVNVLGDVGAELKVSISGLLTLGTTKILSFRTEHNAAKPLRMERPGMSQWHKQKNHNFSSAQ